MSRSTLVGLLLAITTVAAGCGGEEAAGTEAATLTAPPAETAPETAPPTPTETTGSDDDADDTETTSTEAASGSEEVFRVRNAGSVTLRRDGGRLTIVSVDPAAGWRHRVSEEERDEVEVDFRRGGRKLEFEAEIDDGRIEVKVGRDDDD